VSGKTGTAEVGDGTDDLWFIGFTDKFAVCAMLERQTGGTGGANAAPIAAQVLKALGEQ
jgi:cell division protein FtsI/penicillin-binding protein 2